MLYARTGEAHNPPLPKKLRAPWRGIPEWLPWECHSYDEYGEDADEGDRGMGFCRLGALPVLMLLGLAPWASPDDPKSRDEDDADGGAAGLEAEAGV